MRDTALARRPGHTGDLAVIVGIPNGMSSGKPAVALRIDLGDGKWVYVETSWAILSAAVAALRGRYGDPE